MREEKTGLRGGVWHSLYRGFALWLPNSCRNWTQYGNNTAHAGAHPVSIALPDPTLDTATGIALGTRIMTLQGALPVEYLSIGDRVITRSGARALRGLSVCVLRDADIVEVAAGALGHDRPEAPMRLPVAQPVLVRDWRAQALYGTREAMVPVARLVDGEFLRAATASELRLFRLTFDTAEVVYADGVELACEPEAVLA